MTAREDHPDSTARNYWDEPSELAYAKAVVGKKHQDDPAHQWYRLPSLESFKRGAHAAGCRMSATHSMR
jgi:hypothetical protein